MQVFKDRSKIIEGILEAADIVCTTMGPGGQKVVVNDQQISVHTDGVTVARQLVGWYDRTDPEKAAGVRMLLSAAEKTVQRAGDGTTTTCALVHGMLKEFGKDRFYRKDSRKLKEDAEKAVAHIKSIARKPTEEQLINLGIVSANNDPDLGAKIAQMVWKLGKDGNVTNANSKTSETICAVIDGYFLNGGISSIEMLHNRHEIALDNPLILIAEERIDDYKTLLPVFTAYTNTCGHKTGDHIIFSRPLVIIAGDLSETALTTVVRNNQSGYPIYVVRMKEDRRIDLLVDMSAYTGADIFSAAHGKLANFNGAHHFGECDKVVISQKGTRFIAKENRREFIENHIKSIEELIEKGDDDFLKTRLGSLKNAAGIVYIGGATELEKKYTLDVVEDCVRSCLAALTDGIVTGGGAAFLTTASFFQEGETFLEDGLKEPWSRILKNAGITETQGTDFALVEDQLLAYNVETDSWDYEGKIIDSATAAIESIYNSVSLVCEVLETGVLIWK